MSDDTLPIAFNDVCRELAQANAECDALTARVAKLEAALREIESKSGHLPYGDWAEGIARAALTPEPR